MRITTLKQLQATHSISLNVFYCYNASFAALAFSEIYSNSGTTKYISRDYQHSVYVILISLYERMYSYSSSQNVRPVLIFPTHNLCLVVALNQQSLYRCSSLDQ